MPLSKDYLSDVVWLPVPVEFTNTTTTYNKIITIDYIVKISMNLNRLLNDFKMLTLELVVKQLFLAN